MASGNTLVPLSPNNNNAPSWFYLVFSGGGTTTPVPGDRINDTVTGASAVIEYVELDSGTWAGGNAAGYFLLSNDAGVAWTDAGAFSINVDDATDHGTMVTPVPVPCAATPDIVRSDTLVLDFDASINEVALFTPFMPRHYGGGGLTITVGVSSTTGTEDMSWAIFLKSYSDNTDNLSVPAAAPSASGLKVFAAPKFNRAVDAATSAGDVRYFTIEFDNGSEMDSIAAGEYFHLLLMRDARDTVNDLMAADGEIVFLEIRETP